MSILEEIWRIRGEIDTGIRTHDTKQIKQSLTRLRELFDNNAFMKTEASRSFNTAYWTDEGQRRDKFKNSYLIIDNAKNIFSKTQV